MIGAKQYEKALDVCVQQNVPIQEDLIKKILPDEEPTTAMEKSKRNELTKIVAEKCKLGQNLFDLSLSLSLVQRIRSQLYNRTFVGRTLLPVYIF